MHKNVFTLGKHVEKIYSAKCKKIADKHGVSVTEVAILNFLHNNPDTDTAKDFAMFAHMSKSCVSDAIESLMKKGFLIGRQDEIDRRYVHLEIQDSARELLEDGLEVQKEFIDIILNGFNSEEAKLLESLLDRVANNIKNASKDFWFLKNGNINT